MNTLSLVPPQSESPPAAGPETAAVVFEHVSLSFDDDVVLRDVSFRMRAGRLTMLLGGSGSGKSVILKLILGLLKADAGIIRVNGARTDAMSERELIGVRGAIGMLFQESALFDSMTVADNVGYRLYEETDMPADAVRHRVEEVLGFIGLVEYIDRMPADLSGGQRRRVAIARAIAAWPRLLLFDDPTSGLDPITARTVMDEVIKLRDLEHVTPVVVTHQLRDAFYIATHEAVRTGDDATIARASPHKAGEADALVLRDGRIYFDGSAEHLRQSTDPFLRGFVCGWFPPLV